MCSHINITLHKWKVSPLGTYVNTFLFPTLLKINQYSVLFLPSLIYPNQSTTLAPLSHTLALMSQIKTIFFNLQLCYLLYEKLSMLKRIFFFYIFFLSLWQSFFNHLPLSCLCPVGSFELSSSILPLHSLSHTSKFLARTILFPGPCADTLHC